MAEWAGRAGGVGGWPSGRGGGGQGLERPGKTGRSAMAQTMLERQPAAARSLACPPALLPCHPPRRPLVKPTEHEAGTSAVRLTLLPLRPHQHLAVLARARQRVHGQPKVGGPGHVPHPVCREGIGVCRGAATLQRNRWMASGQGSASSVWGGMPWGRHAKGGPGGLRPRGDGWMAQMRQEGAPHPPAHPPTRVPGQRGAILLPLPRLLIVDPHLQRGRAAALDQGWGARDQGGRGGIVQQQAPQKVIACSPRSLPRCLTKPTRSCHSQPDGGSFERPFTQSTNAQPKSP